MGRQWRKKPISCQFCRRRKLRCSHQFPCSNCTTRGVRCQQLHEPQVQSPQLSESSNDGKKIPNSEIYSRLNKLETLISGLTATESPSNNFHDVASPRAALRPASPPLPPTVQHLSEDALQMVRSLCNTKEAHVLNDISFQTLPIEIITKPCSILQLAGSPTSLCLNLPLYEEAQLILDHYTAKLAFLNPIVHAPSLSAVIDSIYANIHQKTLVDKGNILLFLSIIASTTLSCSPTDEIAGLFTSHVEGTTATSIWVAAAFDLVDEMKCGRPSIGSLQGQSILFTTSCHIEGFSPRNNNLLATSISMAHTIGLHRIDLPQHSSPSITASGSCVEVEIARRLWWNFVSFDWLLPFFPGSHEGIYTIQPHHMAVRKPAHINNEDLHDNGAIIPQPWGESTDMSYFLERLRLAELSRALIDRNPLAYARAADRKYDQIVDIDSQLQQYQQALPAFFQFKKSKVGERPSTHPQEQPAIIVQRINLNCLVYYQRCMIHLPYIALSAISPGHASSRRVCLSCAENIIHLYKDIGAKYPYPSWITSLLKATNMLRSLILASMVFLFDICSVVEIGDLKLERPEIVDAWQLMSDVQAPSHLIRQFFEFSIQMLRKYRVSETALQVLQSINPYHDLKGGFERPGAAHNETGNGDEPRPETVPISMDNRWQTLDTDFGLNAMSWEGVFGGFDAVLL